MNMDTNKKHTLLRSIAPAACFLLLAGACDDYVRDGIEPDTPAREVALNFNASIEEKTESVQSRTVTNTIDAFTDNSYSFGLSITKSENGKEPFPGSSDMTAKMERTSFVAPWNWTFTDNSSNPSPVTPIGPEGKLLKVVAYYPPVSSAIKNVYTDGIPFDFSAKSGLEQRDLLYNAEIIQTVSTNVPIRLTFRHAYTWIVLKIRKYVDKGEPCLLSSCTLDNLGGDWIKNKGTVDPETGLAKTGSTAGPIGVELTSPEALLTTEALTYEFLVPSFMDAKVGDGAIILVLKINGINELFPLDKVYLNQEGGKYGFRQGYKNTYELLYNNSALSLSIQNWSSEVINGDFGGKVDASVAFRLVNLKRDGSFSWPSATIQGSLQEYPEKSTYYNANDHPYKDYLTTVAYGGNGAYVPAKLDSTKQPTDGLQITDDENVRKMESACEKIQITQNDISIAPIPWEDENGVLVAKELCRKYNGGDKNDWRLPRASELRALFIRASVDTRLKDLNFNMDANRNKVYWTGTEVDPDNVWGMYCDLQSSAMDSKVVLSPYDKKTTASVRCVRDAN